jgi:DNA-binding LytR/AlgR family response regulator
MNSHKYILLQTSTGEEYITYESIVRIQALSSYSKIFFDNGKILVISKVLQWFESKLNEDCFIRVHRSHLINYNYINNVDTKQKKMLVLKDNTTIDIPRRKKAEVSKLLLRLAAA